MGNSTEECSSSWQVAALTGAGGRRQAASGPCAGLALLQRALEGMDRPNQPQEG